MASVHESQANAVEGWRRRLDLGAYRYAEAARLAQTNPQLIVAWLRQLRELRWESEVEVAEPARVLSYLQLLEIAEVARFRRSGVRLSELARLHQSLLRREVLRDGNDPASRHPFVLRSFKSAGPRHCAEWGGTLLRALAQGQANGRWNCIVGEFFEQVDYDERLIVRWYPRGREHGVVIDPQLSFGAPVVFGTGIPTYIVLDRQKAGESLTDVADDFGLTVEQVKAALRFERALVAHAA
jgi:uncharacterized protein (DUF433 family)/transposase-like protein